MPVKPIKGGKRGLNIKKKPEIMTPAQVEAAQRRMRLAKLEKAIQEAKKNPRKK